MNKLLTFIFGVSIGSVSTYFITKKIIQSKADEEIESVIETFNDRKKEIYDILTEEQKKKLAIVEIEKAINEEDNTNETNIDETEKTINDLGYSVGVDLSENDDNYIENEMIQDVSGPYVISEDEFGEFGNEEVTLLYYADGILATEYDDPIEDIKDLLGNCLEDLGEYDEQLYVRNQEKEVDYVILRSEKNFRDIVQEEDI